MNQTVFTNNPFPKVGIRPIIDGRRRGVRESLEDQTMAMAKAAAKLIREQVRREQRRRFALRDAVLVLRNGDDGPRPRHAEGRLGLQRHGASGSRLSRVHARGLRAARNAGVRNLRTRSAEPRRNHEDPRRRRREDPPLREGGARRRDDEGQELPLDRNFRDGHRGLVRRRQLHAGLPRHRAGEHGRVRDPPPHRGGHLRQGGVQEGARVDARKPQGGQGLQSAQDPEVARGERQGLGVHREDGDHRPRHDGRQSTGSSSRRWRSSSAT